MATRVNRIWATALAASLLALAGAASASAAPTWTRFELPRVNNQEIPLGEVADIECWSSSRCLLLSTGNAAAANGLFLYDGSNWRQYATVCGTKVAQLGRIVWAGPTEFWTITQPSPPRDNANDAGLALCRFKDGQVVGSFSTRTATGGEDPVSDPYRQMNAGACLSPDNCWFGGPAARSPDSARSGSFHLHWNGTTLKTVYAPARRAVAGISVVGDGFVEALLQGPAYNSPPSPDLGLPPNQNLLYDIDPLGVDEEAFSEYVDQPLEPEPLPTSGAELNAITNNADGANDPTHAWAVGGGATSGPGSTSDDPFDIGPVAAVADATGNWNPVNTGSASFGPDTQFTDVSAAPGTSTAFAAVLVDRVAGIFIDGFSHVAKLTPDGAPVVQQFGGQHGTVTKVECTAVDECWAATQEGWLYRYAEPGSTPPVDTEPAFATTVTFRPNEVIEQAISDAPPADDSLLFAPLPEQIVEEPEQQVTQLKAAVRTIRSKLIGTKLRISFTVIRRVRVQFVARKGRKVVARAKTGLLRKGRHSVTLKLKRSKWPDRLAMSVREPGLSNEPEGDDVATTVFPQGRVASNSTACAPPKFGSRCDD